MSFDEVWSTAPGSVPDAGMERFAFSLENLMVPLPDLSGPATAYATTYRVHGAEVRLQDMFSFAKLGTPAGAWAPVVWRPALDFEAEVALLLRRDNTERFGYLLANDLTDRAVQVHTFNRRNPAPGFSEAKGFPGALRVGPLLVMGGGDFWQRLELHLSVNGEKRQEVRARDCLLTPRDFHRQIFAGRDAGDFALVLTGTSAGTIFRGPSPAQRMAAILRAGFSIRRAREHWLKRFRFLQPGDRIEMKSEFLGNCHATIVETDH